MTYGTPPPSPPPAPAPGGSAGREHDISDLAGLSEQLAADIEKMKGQVLIACVLRMGGSVSIPVKEVNATGPYVMSMRMTGQSFLFVVERKQ